MPIDVVNPGSGKGRVRYDHSPVVRLFTDVASADSVPAVVSAAADFVVTANLDPLRNGKVPDGTDGVLIWFENDQLLEGNGAALRKNLRAPGRRTFIPVNYPYLEEMDLVALQPRSFAKGRPQDYWGFNLRIRNPGTASDRVLAALRAIGQPWAQLSLSLLLEVAQPGAGVERLATLWQDLAKQPSSLAALVLRDLVVVLVRHQDFTRAWQLLEQGMKIYEGYAELSYISALLCMREGQPVKATRYLEKMRSVGRSFIGSGGENTYRANWLTALLALRVGNESTAFQHLCPGVNSRPVFQPAVEEIFKLRVPRAAIEPRQWDFCRMVRREPRLLDRTFDYLVLHRAFPAARRLVETLSLPEETRAVLTERLDQAMAPFKPGPVPKATRSGVILEGPFFEHSSLARINREIAASLLQDSDLDAAFEPFAHAGLLPQTVAGGELIRQGMNRHPEQLDLTIRHHWPPDFRRPSRGKLAIILPWEYGAVPRAWISQINQNVDELWVPSRFVRDVFVRGGVPGEHVQVIPNGVDPNLFTPKGISTRPRAARKFMFLFVGGAILRKGIDLLLEAYREAFDAGEDVSLLVTALASHGAYQHNNLTEQVMSFAADPTAPHLELLTGELDDATLANLYRGCDAFVLPYRGEGFCMPALEAMACGKPVITTALGPSQDFCSEKTAYLVPAREEMVPDDPPPLGELAGDFTWFEPDASELARLLRHVWERREEAAQRGLVAAKVVEQKYTWSHITRLYLNRIHQLVPASETAEAGTLALQRA